MASGCRITWRTSSSLMTKWTMIARAPGLLEEREEASRPDRTRGGRRCRRSTLPRRPCPVPPASTPRSVWSHSRPCSAISARGAPGCAGRADPREQRVEPALVGPVGHDLGQRRAPRRVGVDVERDVLPALVGPLGQPRRVADPAPVRAGTPPCGARSGRGRRARSPISIASATARSRSAPRRGCGSRRARRPRPPRGRARPPPRCRRRRPAGRPGRWTARSSRRAWRSGRAPACRRARRRSAAAARIP